MTTDLFRESLGICEAWHPGELTDLKHGFQYSLPHRVAGKSAPKGPVPNTILELVILLWLVWDDEFETSQLEYV